MYAELLAVVYIIIALQYLKEFCMNMILLELCPMFSDKQTHWLSLSQRWLASHTSQLWGCEIKLMGVLYKYWNQQSHADSWMDNNQQNEGWSLLWQYVRYIDTCNHNQDLIVPILGALVAGSLLEDTLDCLIFIKNRAWWLDLVKKLLLISWPNHSSRRQNVHFL